MMMVNKGISNINEIKHSLLWISNFPAGDFVDIVARDFDLFFSMLGERLTTEATRKKNVQSFPEGLEAAKEGGTVAGRARKDAKKIEKK